VADLVVVHFVSDRQSTPSNYVPDFSRSLI